jgi:hypothetical protein
MTIQDIVFYCMRNALCSLHLKEYKRMIDVWNWIQIARRLSILTVMPRAIDSFRTLDDIDVIECVNCIRCSFLHLLPVCSK